jgi:hypothetical protein
MPRNIPPPLVIEPELVEGALIRQRLASPTAGLGQPIFLEAPSLRPTRRREFARKWARTAFYEYGKLNLPERNVHGMFFATKIQPFPSGKNYA